MNFVISTVRGCSEMADLIFPYATYPGRVEARLRARGIAPSDAQMLVLDLYRIVDLSANARRGWTSVSLRLDIGLSDTGPGPLAAIGSDPRVFIEVECDKTHGRWAVPAEPTGEPYSWTAKVDIEREAVAGRIVLRPLVSSPSSAGNYLLAPDYSEWAIYVDEPSAPVIEGSIQVIWRTFAEDTEYPFLAEYRDQPFFTDYGPELPILFLNRGFAGLPELLEDRRGRKPIERALHDLEEVSIARTVWDGLLDVSLASLVVDEETSEVTMPEAEWQQQVIRVLLPGLYPDMAEGDALQQLYEDHQDAAGVKTIESRSQIAVARQLSAHSKLATAIGRIMSQREE